MPISEIGAERLVVDLPPWRRATASAGMRFKHLFGIHTMLPTLKAEMDDHVVTAFRVVEECAVCNAGPGQ